MARKPKPEQEPEPEAGINGLEPQMDGESASHSRSGIPNTTDFMVGGEASNAYNAAKEAILFPADDPSSYIPRAVLTMQFLQDYRMMKSRRQRMYTGFADPEYGDWIMLAGSTAIGGRARDEFVSIVTGEQRMNFGRKSMQAMGDRLKDVTSKSLDGN